MKKCIKPIRWLLITATYFYFGYNGYFQNVLWQKNIFDFLFWLMVVAATLGCLVKDVRDHARAGGCSVPSWLRVSADVFIVLALAALGHFVMAGFGMWVVSCEAYIFDVKETQN